MEALESPGIFRARGAHYQPHDAIWLWLALGEHDVFAEVLAEIRGANRAKRNFIKLLETLR